MSEWKTYKLGELIEINKNTVSKNYLFSEIAYIDTSSVKENRFSELQLLKIDEAPSRAKRIVKENDIIYSTVRPIQRHYGIIKKAKPNLVASTGFAVLTAKRIDPYFLYYYLSQDQIVNYFNSIAEANTTTFPAFSPSLFETLEILAPDLPTQRQIAQILSSLDDKIELNLQMNQTLEAMAQAIFKEWFVNFNYPKSLNHDSFDLSDFQDLKNQGNQENLKNQGSDNGLPKGWRRWKLGEIVDVKGGTTPDTTIDEYWNGRNYWATPKDLSNVQSPVLIDTERKISDLGVKQISSGILPKGTLLLSSRAPIGYLAISQVPISINQGYIAIQGKSVSNLFMLFWLKQNMEAVKSKANGSTFQEISKSNFKLIDVSIPSPDLLQKFDEIIEPIFQKIVENTIQIQSLTQLRDTLLPKLMSGSLNLDSFDFSDESDSVGKSTKSFNHKNQSADK
ncbi:MAG TPA: restriction endonuclease subunit S [Bacteroidales bacterium]|nr:restriction endonuclease subunit S [Bacteroidales bacterium]